MKVTESQLNQYIRDVISLEQGPIYVFDKYIVTEFNEGITVDEECLSNISKILDRFSKGKECFGIISNRINSYAIDACARLKVSQQGQRCKYSSTFVIYTERMENVTSFEQSLYKTTSPTFSQIDLAIEWMEIQLSTSLTT